jgi:hypothetical protein
MMIGAVCWLGGRIQTSSKEAFVPIQSNGMRPFDAHLTQYRKESTQATSIISTFDHGGTAQAYR